MRRFIKDKEASVVEWIILLAIIAVVVFMTSPKLRFYVMYWYEDKFVENVDLALDMEEDEGETPLVPEEVTAFPVPKNDQVKGILKEPTILLSPSGPYIYHYNHSIKLEAKDNGGNHYNIKEPLYCDWSGYVGYTGHSCTPDVTSEFSVGKHVVSVLMCDARGACGSTNVDFNVVYQDPLLTIHTEWDNYIKTGSTSGQWQYDDATNQIYSTKNVGWTGYYNPEDKELKDYHFKFKMGVFDNFDDDAIGWSFRIKDMSNMYYVSIDNREYNGGVGGHHSGLYKLQNGVRTQLVGFGDLKWEHDEWMDVEIKAIDDRIIVILDGEKVADYSDHTDPLLKGAYGPHTVSQANGYFKDLEVDVFN